MDIKTTDKGDNQKKVDPKDMEENDNDVGDDPVYGIFWICLMLFFIIPLCLWMYFNPR